MKQGVRKAVRRGPDRAAKGGGARRARPRRGGAGGRFARHGCARGRRLAEAERLTEQADALAAAETRVTELRTRNVAPTAQERSSAPGAAAAAPQDGRVNVEPREAVQVGQNDRPNGWVRGLLASQQSAPVLADSEYLRSEAAGELGAFMAYCRAMGDFGRMSIGLTSDDGRQAMSRLIGASVDIDDPQAATTGISATGVPIPVTILPTSTDALGEYGRMAQYAQRIGVMSPVGKAYVAGAATAGWGSDTASLAEHAQTRKLVNYTLQVVGGYEDISDMAAWGSSMDIVSGYIASARRAIEGKLSAAIFDGSGNANNQPDGISVGNNIAAARKITLAANTGPTWAEILSLIGKISALYRPEAKWFTSSTSSASMRSTEVSVQKGSIAMSVDGPIGGKEVIEDDSAGFDPFGAAGDYAFFGDLRQAYGLFQPVGQPFYARVGDRWGSDAALVNRIGVYTFADGRVLEPKAIALIKK